MKKLILALGMSTALSLLILNSAEAAPNRKELTVLTSREEIRSFQQANGLKVDGIAGRKTKAAMIERGYKLALRPKKANKRTPTKVAVSQNPFVKCQFLFWEVDCNNPDYVEKSNTNNTATVFDDSQRRNNAISSHKNIDRAKQYVGLHGKNNRQTVKALISKPFDRPVDPARTPWCAAFANAILKENNYDTTDSLWARSFLNYGLATKTPSEGDIVVLKRGRSNYTGHVGFYVNTVTMNGQTYVAVLGGNQGKAINVAYYPINRVLAFRKPV